MLLSNHNRHRKVAVASSVMIVSAMLLAVAAYSPTFAAADVMCTDAADSMMQSCPDSAPTCCFMGTVPAGCCPYATRCNIEAGSCDTVAPPNNHTSFHQLAAIKQVAYIPNAAFYGSIGGVGGVIVFAFLLGLCTMLCKAHLRERRARLQAEAQTAAEEAAAEAQLLGAITSVAAADGTVPGGAAAATSMVHEVDSDEEVEFLREVAARRRGAAGGAAGAAAVPTSAALPPRSTSVASFGATSMISGLWGRLRDAVASSAVVGTTTSAAAAASHDDSVHDVEGAAAAVAPAAAGGGINADTARMNLAASRSAQSVGRAAAHDDDDEDDDDDHVAAAAADERRPLVNRSGGGAAAAGATVVVAVPQVPSMPTTGGSAVSMTREDVMMAALNEDKAAVDAAAALLGLCAVCAERRVQCIGLPCGHLQLCAECARHMRHCPECKAVMKRKIKVFVV